MRKLLRGWIKFSSSAGPDKEFYGLVKEIIGFYPSDIELYRLAMRHKSATPEAAKDPALNNERLEFLGDAVLDSVISAYLYLNYPDQDEGFLTRMRSKIVNGTKLVELAERAGIAPLVESNLQPDRGTKRIFEDAFEAFIGALYLDQGYGVTHEFILKNIVKLHIDLDELQAQDLNYKSQLIEWAQKMRLAVAFETLPDPRQGKRFVSHVLLDGRRQGKGSGVSKKIAEQHAAKDTLENHLQAFEQS